MSKSKRAQKPVSVTLEKAEEQTPDIAFKSNVHPSVIESIKNASQLQEEAQAIAELKFTEMKKEAFKNKLYFYGGIFGAVAVVWLAVRYFNAKPNEKYVQEIVNGATSIKS